MDGENTFVCKADSVQEFARAIDTLYRDRELRGRMGEQCRGSAMKFTIGEVEKTMKDVYSKALRAVCEKYQRMNGK